MAASSSQVKSIGIGWPLGLESLTFRLKAVETLPASVAARSSFHTESDSFPHSSSELDTESTGSFFQDQSITLGSLIGMNPVTPNLRLTKTFLSETLESASMVNFSSVNMEKHEEMISCCICASLVYDCLASRSSSRC